MMAARFHAVARLDVIGRDSHSLKLWASGCFQSPHLRLALGILNFDVDPGMRYDKMHFLDHARKIHEGILVIAVGVMRPHWQSGACCNHHRDTKNRFVPHTRLLTAELDLQLRQVRRSGRGLALDSIFWRVGVSGIHWSSKSDSAAPPRSHRAIPTIAETIPVPG